MSEPVPSPPRAPWLPPQLLKPLLIAFGIGLLLFLFLWLDQRSDSDFFKASAPAAGAVGDDGTLPAPVPADVAGDGNASGLGLPRGDTRVVEQPRIIDEPHPLPLPPPSAPTPPPAAASVETPATALDRPAPRYPREALSRGIGGTVRVRAVIATDGSVERMELADSSGNRHLDRAAMEAVRRWTFRPALRGGQAVRSEVIVPLEFNPRD